MLFHKILTSVAFAVSILMWHLLSSHGHRMGDKSTSIPLVVLRPRNCSLDTQKKETFLRCVCSSSVSRYVLENIERKEMVCCKI
jgi:hypothetical protein